MEGPPTFPRCNERPGKRDFIMSVVSPLGSGRSMRMRLVIIVLALGALAACYNGPNLRDCSEWRTTSIAGCYDGQGGRD
jgi:hypothetical protein